MTPGLDSTISGSLHVVLQPAPVTWSNSLQRSSGLSREPSQLLNPLLMNFSSFEKDLLGSARLKDPVCQIWICIWSQRA